MSRSPVACSLTHVQRQGRDDLLPALAGAAEERVALPEGYRLVFASAPGMIERVASVIAAERECCRFLTFDLHAQSDGGPIVLEMSGPEGTRSFLEHLIMEGSR